jgi:hypothetical protein
MAGLPWWRFSGVRHGMANSRPTGPAVCADPIAACPADRSFMLFMEGKTPRNKKTARRPLFLLVQRRPDYFTTAFNSPLA